MAASDRQTPPIFKRGLPPAARLTIYLALSSSMLVADLHLRYLDTLRRAVTILTYPLQIAAATPAEFVRNASNYFAGLAALKQDNARLRAQQLEASRQLQLLQQLRQENTSMRGLLDMKARIGVSAQAAEIIYAARDPFSRRVVLDKGTQQGIDAGAPVVDTQGLIGQVTRVYPLHAEVNLLTDKEQAVPVMIERSALRAVMFGTGAGLTELRYLAANADVQAGDRIVTSGLDGVYVPGLPVATVLKVIRDSTESFARILCRPMGAVERSGAVLVLGRPNLPLDLATESLPETSAENSPKGK